MLLIWFLWLVSSPPYNSFACNKLIERCVLFFLSLCLVSSLFARSSLLGVVIFLYFIVITEMNKREHTHIRAIAPPSHWQWSKVKDTAPKIVRCFSLSLLVPLSISAPKLHKSSKVTHKFSFEFHLQCVAIFLFRLLSFCLLISLSVCVCCWLLAVDVKDVCWLLLFGLAVLLFGAFNTHRPNSKPAPFTIVFDSMLLYECTSTEPNHRIYIKSSEIPSRDKHTHNTLSYVLTHTH